MNRYAKRYELKDKAKDCLGGNYGTLILGGFLFSLIIFVVVFIFGFPLLLSLSASIYSGGGYSAVSFRLCQIGIVVGRVLSGFLSFGTAYLCLKIACGQWNTYTDIFFGFQRENLLKTLLLTAVRLAFGFLCALPGDYLRTWLLWTSVPAYVVGCCVYIPVALALDVTYFLLLDFPAKRVSEILRDGFRLIRGNRRRLLLLELSFIPLQLLVLLTFGIGGLWLEPYMHMTYTLFYLDLINPQKRA